MKLDQNKLCRLVRVELCEGEEIDRQTLEDNLAYFDAIARLSIVFGAEVKPWHDKYDLVETGCENNKRGYYYWGIPVGHDRCLKVVVEQAD